MGLGWALSLWLLLHAWMGLGNTAGYHRLLTHQSYRTRPWIRALLTLGSAAHSGSPMLWVGTHRMHHAVSDSPADLHSPARGGFWFAHTGWLCGGLRHPLPCALFALSGFGLQVVYAMLDVQRLLGRREPTWRRLCRDLAKEPLMRVLDLPLVIPAYVALQVAAAVAVGGAWGLAWLWSLHVVQNNASWVINSVCHSPRFGRAERDSGDRSRNVRAIAWLTCGDAFHNNHHRHPHSACHALDGGTDPAWWLVCALHRLGWASEVRLPPGHALPRWARRPAAPASTA